MALLAMLVGMVFGISRSSLALGNKVVETQNEEMLNQAFFDFLGQRFAAMPGNTRFDLKYTDGNPIVSDLTLQNVPLNFTWGGGSRVAKTVQLSTVRKRDNYLDIVLRYYENEILPDSNTATKTSMVENKPFAEIVLLKDVAYFEWRVLDGRTMEWQYDWDIQGRLPLQLELKIAFGAQGEELRHVFWVTPKQNPETLMRQLQQGQGNPQGGGQGGGQGGEGAVGGGISVPGAGGGQRPPGGRGGNGGGRRGGNGGGQ